MIVELLIAMLDHTWHTAMVELPALYCYKDDDQRLCEAAGRFFQRFPHLKNSVALVAIYDIRRMENMVDNEEFV